MAFVIVRCAVPGTRLPNRKELTSKSSTQIIRAMIPPGIVNTARACLEIVLTFIVVILKRSRRRPQTPAPYHQNFFKNVERRESNPSRKWPFASNPIESRTKNPRTLSDGLSPVVPPVVNVQHFRNCAPKNCVSFHAVPIVADYLRIGFPS